MAHAPDVSENTVDTRSAAEVREALQRLQRENTALRQENAQLRQQLKTTEDWEHQTAQYQREQTAGGAVVYLFTGTPKHYACPSCFSHHVLQVLQEKHAASGTFDCRGCLASYPIQPKRVFRKPSLWSS
jgi:glutaredoxin-related protein